MTPLEFINSFESYMGKPCVTKELKRNEFLIREGEVERFVYAIISGAVRAFYVSNNEEFTIRFGYQGSVINSIGSFITEQPSEFSIQALRKTMVKKIPRGEYFNFIQSSNDVLFAHSNLLNQVIVSQMDREIDILTSSPLLRYKRVLERSPQLFQEVPLKYIASYLRMTPETLSRIRASELG